MIDSPLRKTLSHRLIFICSKDNHNPATTTKNEICFYRFKMAAKIGLPLVQLRRESTLVDERKAKSKSNISIRHVELILPIKRT